MAWRLFLFFAALLLNGCSFQATLDRLVDPARQTELTLFAQQLCTDPAQLRTQFKPDLWAQSERLFAQLSRECPAAGAEYQLTTFRFNVASDTSGAREQQEYAVVVGGSNTGPWSEFALSFDRAGDGPPLLSAWNVQRMTEPPLSLTYLRNWDAAVRWLQFGGVILALIIAGSIWWLVRHARRRKAVRAAGAHSTTPPDTAV